VTDPTLVAKKLAAIDLEAFVAAIRRRG